jgi:biopolymer transport protein ExbD
MRYLESRKPRIEIIPMIDIMLFLLVFFIMMALKMIPTSGHVTKLPTSSTTTIIQNSKMTVEVLENNSLIVDNKPMQAGELTNLLKQKDTSNLMITVVGADTVSLQTLMIVIDAIKLSGANQIALAAHNKSK